MNGDDLQHWSTPAQEALVLALHRHGHTQPDASARLDELGAAVSQQRLSKLLALDGNARSIRRELAEALAEYCNEVDVDLAGTGHHPDFDDEFIEAGEPDLGGRRAVLVDGLLERLGSVTGPVTREELELIAWLSTVERLSPPLRLDRGSADQPGGRA